MNIWHDIDPAEITPEDFTAVVEIPRGSSCKYELDKKTGLVRLDRVLYTATHYPANYGFIPRTLADDGDPLDVLVLCTESLYPLTLVRVAPIGAMRMIDSGKLDDKIIAVPFSDPTYLGVKSMDELPPHVLAEIRHFFTVYKQLENKQTAVREMFSREEAVEIIRTCIRQYSEAFSKKRRRASYESVTDHVPERAEACFPAGARHLPRPGGVVPVCGVRPDDRKQ